MPEFVARSALAGVWAPGRSGNPAGEPGVTVTEQAVETCVQLAGRVPASCGLALPEKPGWADTGGFRAVWLGPERWLLFGSGDLSAVSGSITDQSDSRVVLRLSGPRVREALAKMLTIDLHPRAFRTGDAAVTLAGHIGVAIWQLDEAPTYDLAIARSYAGSFVEWLIGSAAEFGLHVA